MAVPARRQWVLMALLVVSISINYIDRSNLSVAAPDLRRELRLTPEHLGLLLSAFFWSYAALQMVAGWVVDHYEVYRIYGACFLLWSVATALTGFANSFAMLFGLRLVLGTGESIAYPAYSRIIARDYPERRRGLANALIDAGSKVGPAIGTLLGGLVIAGFGWRSLFFLLGFGALLWVAPWFALVPQRADLPRTVKARGGPGYLDIARKRDAWGTFLALFCVNYAWYFVLTWLPSYFVMERKFSMTMMAIWGSLPYWGIAASSVFGGWASDRLIAGGAGTTRVRKTFVASGLLLMTLMLPAVMVRSNVLSLALMIAGCLSFGLCSSNLWAITQTLAGPEAAGRWTGMQNCLGNIAGVVAPYLTGYLVQKTGHFFAAFAVVCLWLVVGACSFLFIVGRIEPAKWDRITPPGQGASGETASVRG